MANKRKRKNTQRGMHRKMISGKKPMSDEEKEARKKIKETQREENKARLSKKN
jgi:hypothetical protein